MANLEYLTTIFGEHLNLHKEVILVDCRNPRSSKVKNLKGILNQIADPLRVSR